ncbi:restriction endonuclease subunit S [Nocardia sp. NRRL WC-3656]|uniref:restriction endonuclease subunit S n=1 Tax=Nocardia sp. NRRL WC-3656 TaxID=1463824 RepID=UPI0018CC32F2|nr:restriction endonuclease subunit S [Nocardia sp. NRRL WC-3656]
MGITSPAYWVMHIDQIRAEPRFLHHLLRSKHMVAEYERLGKNQPPNQFDISWDAFRSIEIPLPPLDEQRRIADFLDAETSRIDALIEFRRRQAALFSERWVSTLSHRLLECAQEFGGIRLRHWLTKIEQGWSPQCEDRAVEADEWGVIKAGCVNSGMFDPMQHKALPRSIDPRKEYLLRKGDLLMSRASGSPELIGSVGIVGELSAKLLLCDKVYRLNLDLRLAEPTFVAHALRAHQVREHIKLGISGAEGMANNLPTSVVKDCIVPDVPIASQRSLAVEFDAYRLQIDGVKAALARSVTLLAERRQALVTAAVTGQFNVTTASGRNLTQGV